MQAPPGPSDPLHQFLASNDAPCPACGYNLRAAATHTCPECGVPLRLSVQKDQRPTWWLKYLPIAALITTGINATFGAKRWFELFSMNRGAPTWFKWQFLAGMVEGAVFALAGFILAHWAWKVRHQHPPLSLTNPFVLCAIMLLALSVGRQCVWGFQLLVGWIA